MRPAIGEILSIEDILVWWLKKHAQDPRSGSAVLSFLEGDCEHLFGVVINGDDRCDLCECIRS